VLLQSMSMERSSCPLAHVRDVKKLVWSAFWMRRWKSSR
jgi:hypothetical protein